MTDVMQEDREVAADIWANYVARIGEGIVERQMRKGTLDDGLPSILAAHRQATASSLAAENARLRQALKPFAEHAEFYESCEAHPNGCPDDAQAGEIIDITVGDFRRASAALKGE